MKRLIASSLVTLMTAAALAAPALGQSEKKTELVELDGKTVDSMPLRHNIDATWVVDTQNLLYRDTARDYYLVTLKQACRQLEVRRGFSFHPSAIWQLRETRTYEVRPYAGEPCGVARIEQVDHARADTLREGALRRAW